MLVILSGVSGSGKDTIKKALMQINSNITTLPSYTSRNPREGEVEGNPYCYVTKEQFEEMIKNKEFYEYNVHHENYYGTSRKLMNQKINDGKIIVKDIDVNGTENLIELLKNDTKIVTIFLRVDKEELEKRLIQREDNLTEEQIKLRLGRLDYEEDKMKKYDYVISNNNFEKTVTAIKAIIDIEIDVEKKIKKQKEEDMER